eukprot:1158429-Pelagomonas_calceolata.AAC.6
MMRCEEVCQPALTCSCKLALAGLPIWSLVASCPPMTYMMWHVRAGVERIAGGRYFLPDDEEAGLAQQSTALEKGLREGDADFIKSSGRIWAVSATPPAFGENNGKEVRCPETIGLLKEMPQECMAFGQGVLGKDKVA